MVEEVSRPEYHYNAFRVRNRPVLISVNELAEYEEVDGRKTPVRMVIIDILEGVRREEAGRRIIILPVQFLHVTTIEWRSRFKRHLVQLGVKPAGISQNEQAST
jgi:hypothetical protein